MGLKNLLLRMVGADDASSRRTCVRLYKQARQKRPDREIRDTLKVVLITKPPFDYQPPGVIEKLLDEAGDIQGLADIVCRDGRESFMWEIRGRSKSNRTLLAEREQYLSWFWHGK